MGFSRVVPKKFISFSIKKPATAGKNSATPAVEACALCAVPKASFTYNSARLASSFANSLSFASSLESNLTFSSKTTSPFFILVVKSFALSPIISDASFTS